MEHDNRPETSKTFRVKRLCDAIMGKAVDKSAL